MRERIVFLPNYDIGMAQLLYPGTDVWLNNPLRPLEACGTSGMKAALNGSLNLSILDGWWNEFYDDRNGWAIPSADQRGDAAERDALEAACMYDLIEHQIAPRFYDRDADGVPARWVADIRHTLAHAVARALGRPHGAGVRRAALPAGGGIRAHACRPTTIRPARDLAAWKARVSAAWPDVHVTHVESGGVDATPQVGDELHVRAFVELGALRPDDVAVELELRPCPRRGAAGRRSAGSGSSSSAEAPGEPAAIFGGTVALARGQLRLHRAGRAAASAARLPGRAGAGRASPE